MATKKAVTSVKKSTAKKATKTSTVKAVTANKSAGIFSSPLKGMPYAAALVAEFIGTFLFAAAIITGQGQPIIILFALAGIVLLIGALSGAHLNPAITIGAWVTRKITGLRAIGYIIAQVVGAFAALGLLTTFLGGVAQPADASYAAASLYQAAILPEGKEWYLFFSELIGAAVLGLAIATSLRYKADRVASALVAGLGIFVALLLAASAASYVGGTAIINPAVAFSLNALKWEMWPLAIYILAPIIGGVIGFIVHDILRVEDNK